MLPEYHRLRPTRRSEFRDRHSNPIRQNSTYDNDVPRLKTKVFDHVIGVTYDYETTFKGLQHPSIFRSKIENIGEKIRSTIIEPVALLFRPRVNLESINPPQIPVEPPIQRIDLEQK